MSRRWEETIESISLTYDKFESLPEYSLTLPTPSGINDLGKKWKRKWPPQDGREWYLCEYVKHPTDDSLLDVDMKRITAVFKIKKYKI